MKKPWGFFRSLVLYLVVVFSLVLFFKDDIPPDVWAMHRLFWIHAVYNLVASFTVVWLLFLTLKHWMYQSGRRLKAHGVEADFQSLKQD